MFQTFTTTADPSKGAGRLERLRRAMGMKGLDGFFVPRADAHQGEYVAACDARLAWLTGFTGSAGFCIALTDVAGIFVDGRYRVQVREQADMAAFSAVDWPEVQPGDWLKDQISGKARIGFDPWLHTKSEIEKIEKALDGTGITLVPTDNLVDQIWEDRPAPPSGKIVEQPLEFAGQSSTAKRGELADELLAKGQKACAITLSDSIAWLLNIRGDDIPCIPVVQGFAILSDDTSVQFFTTEGRNIDARFDADVTLNPIRDFRKALTRLDGPVRVDRASAPYAVWQILTEAGIEIDWAEDPAILPKAQKNPTELKGARAAHLRDAAAVVEFLAWFDAADKASLTEIDLVKQLEEKRRATNALMDISFETIAGAGPNGAIMHYRVTEDTNRTLEGGNLVVLDSGGQYRDGTTDITRVLRVGEVAEDEKRCFTRVLQGMIALSRTYFPKGRTGRDLDAVARYPLWAAHQDFNHGTGHGVGAYLSVHEGPQRFSPISEIELLPGMILSNEPGYYRNGAFGIRLENLVVVQNATAPAGGDSDRSMLNLETLTYVPIDTSLIVPGMLSGEERDWLNAYHAKTLELLSDHVSDVASSWLETVCAPI
ncbi:Xaa-Pro aminopeptidase [Aliiroseovarius halocynthiae]|uniref:Aminopeptidase P family protein n=1 Tax=Aliiroseovarius halocynthiae TaxID=985055 RepID=A0A545SWT5_9RHOB|nr:aminopeptidase P family protein [Aliiroseovarius halocynthiae]TQV69416.1 aminopeptidase P family protein [Aliiroseovarius halocynthiae]SMR72809.1 Xaa-Pro aminopeptidase [Aliiroseovarius halocynthiae]